MTRLALLPLAAAALIAAGCGEESANGGGTKTEAATTTAATAAKEPSPTAQSAARKPGKRIEVVDSQYGRVIADGKGEALYLFDAEGGAKSKCYGTCARAWPPVLTGGRPRAIRGAKQGLLGTTVRRNGKRQVTYAGHPLYYYVDDSPGTILCHDVEEFGGTWLVVEPNGSPAA
jgi:predicted lipoprotein with Yx(FWY)xxD motif